MITPLLTGIAAGLTTTVLAVLFYADDEDPLYPSRREVIKSGLSGTVVGGLILIFILLLV